MSNSLDLLLVHPNASKKIYQDLSKTFSAIEPPIWAGMLATFVRNKGHNVQILDCEAEQLSVDEAAEKIKELSPRIVAIVVYGQQPSASTQNMTGAVLLSNELEKYGIQRIYVGAHPSALPKRTLQDDPTAFVCQGEGAHTLDALLKVDLSSGEGLDEVPGLWYYDSDTKEIKNTAPAALISNLEEDLPGVAWDLLPMEKYSTANWHSWSNDNDKQPFASIYTSLGCPYKCTFCMINAPFGINTFRYWDPEFMITEFDKLAEMGITNIKIADELFVLNPNHFMRLCDLIIERGHKFNIWCYARIDTVKPKYLKTLKAAGVNWLALGIESANTVVRKDVVKGKFEDVNIRDIVGEIRDAGINVIGNFIFGLPEDNQETMQETLDLSKELNCEMINFYSAMAYPGSKLYDLAVEDEAPLPDSWIGYSQHSYECRPLDTKHISGPEVLAFRDKAFHEYFANEDYLNMIEARFGSDTMENIKSMTSHRLARKEVDK